MSEKQMVPKGTTQPTTMTYVERKVEKKTETTTSWFGSTTTTTEKTDEKMMKVTKN